jgi:hypothetical protein
MPSDAGRARHAVGMLTHEALGFVHCSAALAGQEGCARAAFAASARFAGRP